MNGGGKKFEVCCKLFDHFVCVCFFPAQNVNPMMGGSSVAQGRGGPQTQVPPQPNLRNQVPPPILPSQVTHTHSFFFSSSFHSDTLASTAHYVFKKNWNFLWTIWWWCILCLWAKLWQTPMLVQKKLNSSCHYLDIWFTMLNCFLIIVRYLLKFRSFRRV